MEVYFIHTTRTFSKTFKGVLAGSRHPAGELIKTKIERFLIVLGQNDY